MSVGKLMKKTAFGIMGLVYSLSGFFLSANTVLAAKSQTLSTNSVVINEFVSDPASGEDWVELYNPSSETIDVSSWSINDNTGVMHTFDSDSQITASGFLVIDVSNQLNNNSNTISVLSDIGAVVDTVVYPSDVSSPQQEESAIRLPDGTGPWQITNSATKNTSNSPSVSTPTTVSQPGEAHKVVAPQTVTGSSLVIPANAELFTDFIKPRTDLGTFSSIIKTLSLESYFDSESLTVFGPNNEAFAFIPTAEMDELSSNPAQLHEFLANHVVQTKMVSSDFTNGQTLTSLAGLDLQITVSGKDVFINGKKISVPDQVADNGTLNVMAGVLLPNNPQVTINDFSTNKVSPSLSGTICEGANALTIRVNGVAYDADDYIDSADNTWAIPEGIVSLDPISEKTLFSLVTNCPKNRDELRSISDFTEENEDGGEVALTMRDDVMSYARPDTDNGNVLGASTPPSSTSVVTASVTQSAPSDQYYYGYGCGKGVCGEDLAVQTDSGFIDENHNGIPDDQEQLADDGKTDDQAMQDAKQEATNEEQASWWWWVAGFGTVGVLWYLLWRKSGKEGE